MLSAGTGVEMPERASPAEGAPLRRGNAPLAPFLVRLAPLRTVPVSEFHCRCRVFRVELA